MNFANPTMLWWAALAAPIVVLYILKVRMRRTPVSTVIFWRQIFEEKQPRSIWRRLRHLLSLLAQLALLALLVLALADPFFSWEVLQARRVVVVLDNSASMGARDEEPTRLAAARNEVAHLIDGLRTRDQMALIAAGAQPKVACGLTNHQRTLREALAAVPQTDGPTEVAEAVTLARRLLAGHKNSQVIVLSDGGFAGAEALSQADDVKWRTIGRRAENVAITQFQVRRSLHDPIGYEILVEAANFSDESVKARLDIDLGSEVVDVVPLELAPGDTWSRVLRKTSAEGGRLSARLSSEDVLASDNRAWAILPTVERQPVVLVTEGDLFLQKVFEAQPLVDLAVVAEPPPVESLPREAVVVFHRQVPQQLPEGKFIVIDPADDTDRWKVGELLADPAVVEQDADSPLMAHVRLDNVRMPEARRLEPPDGATLLAETAGGDPLYFAWEGENRKTLVLTVNLEKGDLPLRTAFPILMTNALAWMAGPGGELRESLAAGAITQIPADALDHEGEGPLVLVSPGEARRELPPSDEELAVGPLSEAGVWRIEPRRGGEPSQEPLLEIACNVANREESNLWREGEFAAPAQSASLGFGGRPIWFYLASVALLATVSEWWLHQRRWID